jgi:hypothetical protein
MHRGLDFEEMLDYIFQIICGWLAFACIAALSLYRPSTVFSKTGAMIAACLIAEWVW